MKHKYTIIMPVLAVICIALAAQANAAVTFNFQENGPGDLGTTSTFTESGVSLTAAAFLTAGGPTNLFAKFTSGNPSETGLGTAIDGDHEINTTDFVQLTLPTTPPSNFQMVLVTSVQTGEQAEVFFSNTSGVLGTTMIGTVTGHDGSVTIGPAFQGPGFIDITAGAKNVLLESATVSTTVPDGGSAVALLGIALAGIEVIRRKVRKA